MNGILSFIWIRIVSWLNLKVYLPGSRPLSHWASGSERLDSPIIGWPALASLTCSLTESDRCPLESPEIETFDSKAFNQKQINNFSYRLMSKNWNKCMRWILSTIRRKEPNAFRLAATSLRRHSHLQTANFELKSLHWKRFCVNFDFSPISISPF